MLVQILLQMQRDEIFDTIYDCIMTCGKCSPYPEAR